MYMGHLENNKQKGIIKYLLVVVAAIFLFAYFRNDIQSFLASDKVKDAMLTTIGWIQQAFSWIVGKLGWASSQIK